MKTDSIASEDAAIFGNVDSSEAIYVIFDAALKYRDTDYAEKLFEKFFKGNPAEASQLSSFLLGLCVENNNAVMAGFFMKKGVKVDLSKGIKESLFYLAAKKRKKEIIISMFSSQERKGTEEIIYEMVVAGLANPSDGVYEFLEEIIYFDIMKLLITKENVLFKDKYDKNKIKKEQRLRLFGHAMKCGNLTAVKKIVEGEGSSIINRTESSKKHNISYTPILLSAAYLTRHKRSNKCDKCDKCDKFLSVIAYMLEAGASKKFREGVEGGTLLHYAAEHGLIEIFDWVIDKDLKVNHKIKGGATPLHLAALSGNAASVAALIKRGADIKLKHGRMGKTALEIANSKGNKDCVEVLEEEQEKLNKQEAEERVREEGAREERERKKKEREEREREKREREEREREEREREEREREEREKVGTRREGLEGRAKMENAVLEIDDLEMKKSTESELKKRLKEEECNEKELQKIIKSILDPKEYFVWAVREGLSPLVINIFLRAGQLFKKSNLIKDYLVELVESGNEITMEFFKKLNLKEILGNDSFRKEILEKAVEKNNHQALEFFIDNSNEQDVVRNLIDVLSFVAKYNNLNVIRFLAEKYWKRGFYEFSFNTGSHKFGNILSYAAKIGNIELAKYIFLLVGDRDLVRFINDSAALQFAASEQKLEMMLFLLKNGADASNVSWTPKKESIADFKVLLKLISFDMKIKSDAIEELRKIEFGELYYNAAIRLRAKTIESKERAWERIFKDVEGIVKGKGNKEGKRSEDLDKRRRDIVEIILKETEDKVVLPESSAEGLYGEESSYEEESDNGSSSASEEHSRSEESSHEEWPDSNSRPTRFSLLSEVANLGLDSLNIEPWMSQVIQEPDMSYWWSYEDYTLGFIAMNPEIDAPIKEIFDAQQTLIIEDKCIFPEVEIHELIPMLAGGFAEIEKLKEFYCDFSEHAMKQIFVPIGTGDHTISVIISLYENNGELNFSFIFADPMGNKAQFVPIELERISGGFANNVKLKLEALLGREVVVSVDSPAQDRQQFHAGPCTEFTLKLISSSIKGENLNLTTASEENDKRLRREVLTIIAASKKVDENEDLTEARKKLFLSTAVIRNKGDVFFTEEQRSEAVILKLDKFFGRAENLENSDEYKELLYGYLEVFHEESLRGELAAYRNEYSRLQSDRLWLESKIEELTAYRDEYLRLQGIISETMPEWIRLGGKSKELKSKLEQDASNAMGKIQEKLDYYKEWNEEIPGKLRYAEKRMIVLGLLFENNLITPIFDMLTTEEIMGCFKERFKEFKDRYKPTMNRALEYAAHVAVITSVEQESEAEEKGKKVKAVRAGAGGESATSPVTKIESEIEPSKPTISTNQHIATPTSQTKTLSFDRVFHNLMIDI